MNTKKSISQRIESGKGIFFKTGIIIAMVMVLAAMPRWTPGQMGLDRVRVSFSIPVRFRLDQ